MTLDVRRSPSDHGSAWPTSRLTGVGKAGTTARSLRQEHPLEEARVLLE